LVLFEAICFAVVLLSSCVVPECLAVSVEEAGDAVREAEANMSSVFVAVAMAKDAGANVSALLSKLNDAGVFLSEGYDAFRGKEYEVAVSLASACSNSLEGVADEARQLEFSAARISGDGIIIALVCSVVGLIALFVFGLIGWSYLKKSYTKKYSI